MSDLEELGSASQAYRFRKPAKRGLSANTWFAIIAAFVALSVISAITSRMAQMAKENTPIERLDAREFAEAYDKNEIAADVRFKGKPVMIDGEIASILRDDFGRGIVTMKSHTAIGIRCYVKDEASMSGVAEGDRIVMSGVGEGLHWVKVLGIPVRVVHLGECAVAGK